MCDTAVNTWSFILFLFLVDLRRKKYMTELCPKNLLCKDIALIDIRPKKKREEAVDDCLAQ